MAAGTVKFSDKKQAHSLYQKLSDFNGELKSLTLEQTQEKLRELKLNDKYSMHSQLIVTQRLHCYEAIYWDYCVCIILLMLIDMCSHYVQ